MAASGVEKSSKKKTEKKLAAREEAKLLAGFMGVMNNMRKQVVIDLMRKTSVQDVIHDPQGSRVHN